MAQAYRTATGFVTFVEKTKLEAPDSMIENYLNHLVENNKAQQPNMTNEQEKQIKDSSKVTKNRIRIRIIRIH